GLLPPATEILFAATALRLSANALGIAKVETGPDVGRLHFARQNHIDPARLITLVQSDSRAYRLEGDARLVFFRDMPTTEQRVQAVETLLTQLGGRSTDIMAEAAAAG